MDCHLQAHIIPLPQQMKTLRPCGQCLAQGLRVKMQFKECLAANMTTCCPIAAFLGPEAPHWPFLASGLARA